MGFRLSPFGMTENSSARGFFVVHSKTARSWTVLPYPSARPSGFSSVVILGSTRAKDSGARAAPNLGQRWEGSSGVVLCREGGTVAQIGDNPTLDTAGPAVWYLAMDRLMVRYSAAGMDGQSDARQCSVKYKGFIPNFRVSYWVTVVVARWATAGRYDPHLGAIHSDRVHMVEQVVITQTGAAEMATNYTKITLSPYAATRVSCVSRRAGSVSAWATRIRSNGSPCKGGSPSIASA